MKLTNLLRTTAKSLKRNSSLILSVLGTVGVVATAVSAVKVQTSIRLAQEDYILEKQNNGEDPPTKTENFFVSLPHYTTTILVGAATITCIFGIHTVSKRKQAALTAAYSMLERSYRGFRERVEATYGKDVVKTIQKEIITDEMEKDRKKSEIKHPVDPTKYLFYIENPSGFKGRYFTRTIEEILYAEYHFNRNFCLRMNASINELYSFYGLEELEGGDSVGWDAGEMLEQGYSPWIDFCHDKVTMDDGLECYIISMPIGPITNYYDFPWEPDNRSHLRKEVLYG